MLYELKFSFLPVVYGGERSLVKSLSIHKFEIWEFFFSSNFLKLYCWSSTVVCLFLHLSPAPQPSPSHHFLFLNAVH